MGVYQTAERECQHTTQEFSDMVKDHPDEAVIGAFTAGAILGLVIGASLAGSSSQRKWNSSWSGSTDGVAQRLGEGLMSSLETVVPSSLAKAFGSK